MSARKGSVVAVLASAFALVSGGGCGTKTVVPPPAQKKIAPLIGEIMPTERIRPICPIRLGGVYLMGLGDDSALFEESATQGVKLSVSNRNWVAAHCDVAAFSPNTLAPDDFPSMRRQQKLFTPLLYLYASSLYEQPDHKGNVGGWKPEMSAWTLRDHTGAEVKSPDPGGHWMDFGSTLWAAHWRKQTESLCRDLHAFGAVAAEMPLGNTFVGDDLEKYKTEEDRGAATEAWLRAALDTRAYLLVPSSINFEQLTGHTTPLYPHGLAEPQLVGRYWDQFPNITDGAWAENWIHPYYWIDKSTETNPQKAYTASDSLWEIQMEAADRAARMDKVFIVAAAYQTESELEYELASYLLVAKRQARVVFQPMPLLPNEPSNAGLSLAVLKRETAKWAAYFDAPLGAVLQERHAFTLNDGAFWRRQYQFGDVYVNSDDNRSVTIELGSKMKRVNGTIVQRFVLAPHSGAILLYLPNEKK